MWMVIFILSFLSLLIVYSSTGALAFRRANGDTTRYFIRQVIFQLWGILIILIMIRNVSVNLYNKYANLAMVAAMVCILAGIVIGRGSGRTIPLGLFSFQPAELAKVALIVWVARILSKMGDSEKSKRLVFSKIMLGVGILALLLLIVNFSSSVLILSTAFIMMFVGQVPGRYLTGIFIVAAILFASTFMMRKFIPEAIYDGSRLETVFNRVDRFISGKDPKREEGLTQDEFAKIAIFKGGFLGVGAGKGDISNRMSAAYNDFVFAIIVEEYGLLGAGIIILLYLVFLTRGLMIIKACKRTFPLFLATGAVTMILMQALVNMGVSAGAIPVTGQPLPWISWGGTSQLFTAVIFGFLLSVSAENQAGIAKQETSPPVEEDEFPEEEYSLNYDN
jgi:cell division protein FtsW